MEQRYVLFALASPSRALRVEAALRSAGVDGKVIPTPRSLSSECGVCLRVAFTDRERAQLILAESGTTVSAIHEVDWQATKVTDRSKEAE